MYTFFAGISSDDKELITLSNVELKIDDQQQSSSLSPCSSPKKNSAAELGMVIINARQSVLLIYVFIQYKKV